MSTSGEYLGYTWSYSGLTVHVHGPTPLKGTDVYFTTRGYAVNNDAAATEFYCYCGSTALQSVEEQAHAFINELVALEIKENTA